MSTGSAELPSATSNDIHAPGDALDLDPGVAGQGVVRALGLVDAPGAGRGDQAGARRRRGTDGRAWSRSAPWRGVDGGAWSRSAPWRRRLGEVVGSAARRGAGEQKGRDAGPRHGAGPPDARGDGRAAARCHRRGGGNGSAPWRGAGRRAWMRSAPLGPLRAAARVAAATPKSAAPPPSVVIARDFWGSRAGTASAHEAGGWLEAGVAPKTAASIHEGIFRHRAAAKACRAEQSWSQHEEGERDPPGAPAGTRETGCVGACGANAGRSAEVCPRAESPWGGRGVGPPEARSSRGADSPHPQIFCGGRYARPSLLSKSTRSSYSYDGERRAPTPTAPAHGSHRRAATDRGVAGAARCARAHRCSSYPGLAPRGPWLCPQPVIAVRMRWRKLPGMRSRSWWTSRSTKTSYFIPTLARPRSSGAPLRARGRASARDSPGSRGLQRP